MKFEILFILFVLFFLKAQWQTINKCSLVAIKKLFESQIFKNCNDPFQIVS